MLSVTLTSESEMDADQFGFSHGFGTKESMLALNVFLQKCYDQRKDVMFVFDRVKHEKLLEILKKQRVDLYDLRIIKNLYQKQTLYEIFVSKRPSF